MPPRPLDNTRFFITVAYIDTMQRIFILIPLLLLAACVDPAAQEVARMQREAEDHNECMKLGFHPNTDAYGNCRLKLMEIRAVNRAANRVYYEPRPVIGYHYNRF